MSIPKFPEGEDFYRSKRSIIDLTIEPLTVRPPVKRPKRDKVYRGKIYVFRANSCGERPLHIYAGINLYKDIQIEIKEGYIINPRTIAFCAADLDRYFGTNKYFYHLAIRKSKEKYAIKFNRVNCRCRFCHGSGYHGGAYIAGRLLLLDSLCDNLKYEIVKIIATEVIVLPLNIDTRQICHKSESPQKLYFEFDEEETEEDPLLN